MTGHAVRARRVALGTNAFPSLLRRTRLHTVPVYDYALMTEPLSAEQLASLGWASRAGVGDMSNQFHYYRLSEDDRILWGGYDAIYHYGRRLGPSLDQRPETFDRLAEHSSPPSPSSMACGSPTGGEERSTPAPGSVPSTGRHSAVGSPTRWATPGSVWGRRASAPR